MRRVLFLALAGACPLTGCIPDRFTSMPGVSGRVTDARTSRPVAGAKVTFANVSSSTTVATAADGRFLIAPQREWGAICLLFPTDRFLVPAPLTVEAPGYTPFSRKLSRYSSGSSVQNLGDIPLARARRRHGVPITQDRAHEIACLYFSRYFPREGCGGAGLPNLRDGIWESDVRIGYAGKPGGAIRIDRLTGNVSYAGPYRGKPSVSAQNLGR